MPSSPGRERVPSSPGLTAREPLRDSTPPPAREATPTPPHALEPAQTPTPPPAASLDDSEPLTPPKPVVSRPPAAPEPSEASVAAAAAATPPEDAPALTPTPAVTGVAAAGPRPASRPAQQGPRRPMPPPVEPQSLIAAPVASRQPNAGNSLPSIMLAPSIETDSEQPSMRSVRSTRATVRLSSVEALEILRQARASSSPPASSAPQISARSLSPASIRELMLRTKPWSWIAGGGLLLVLLLVWILWPSTGALMVTVSGPGGAPVDGVKVLVDGKPVCESSPCKVEKLDEGVHFVRATALGMAETADETVSVSSGGEAVHNIRLAPTVGETGGLQINAGAVPLTLVLDGRVIGPLPQKLSGLVPGEHWIKLESTTGEPPIEKGVVIGAGEILQVEPGRLKSNKTLVTIELSRESEGATVTLNDDFLLDFPAELELVPGEPHELHASKPGFKDYKAQIKIAPGEASKHLIVDLEPLQSGRARQRAPSRAATAPAPAKPKPTANAAASSTAPGVLNINSTPPSSVILNGRPLGMTPRTGIEVPGNSMQTVIFVHPTMGRRRAQQIVPAGQTKTISIRF
jgi:serine/threonine-protein kinase